MKKNLTHGAWQGPSMRQCMYYKGHEMLKKARKFKMVTRTFWTDGITMTNTSNLCKILGGLRNVSFNTMKSHRKTILTLQQDRKEIGTRNHGNFHWMQKVFRDLWISAVTLKRRSRHSKDWSMNTQRSLEVETKKQQVRHRRDQQFGGVDEYGYRLEASTGWRYCPFSITHSSSSSS